MLAIQDWYKQLNRLRDQSSLQAQITNGELDKLREDLADALDTVAAYKVLLEPYAAKTPAEIEYADLIPEPTQEERGVVIDLASRLGPATDGSTPPPLLPGEIQG
jgi:hypothetical protein